MIIKDSSANKCGVICSSYEIIASMLLDENEFISVKEIFVNEVLQKLRHLAKLEADAIFREARFRPDLSLPQVSAEISLAINKASDSIAETLSLLPITGGILEQVIYDYLPLVLHSYAKERLTQKVPAEYLHRVIASSLASRIVYREGLGMLKYLSGDSLFDIAHKYFQAEERVAKLIDGLNNREPQAVTEIGRILEIGGAKAMLLS